MILPPLDWKAYVSLILLVVILVMLAFDSPENDISYPRVAPDGSIMIDPDARNPTKHQRGIIEND